MQKFGEFICKHKKIILIIALILLIPSVIGMKATKINYDILMYLPDDIETVQGESILAQDFNMGAFSMITVDNMKTKDILKLEDKLKKIGNVEKVVSIADVIGTDIPEDVLPDEIKDKLYKDGSTIILATFKDSISDEETLNTVEEIRKVLLSLKEKGKLIILASHSKEDIQILCDTVFRMDHGKIIATETN